MQLSFPSQCGPSFEMCPPSGVQPYGNFTIMHPPWRNSQRVISTIFYKWVLCKAVDIDSHWLKLSFYGPQCSLPVFEGLFLNSAHNWAIQDLIFILAEWHANMNLHMHTTSLLAILGQLTHDFGVRIRHFARHLCLTRRSSPKKRQHIYDSAPESVTQTRNHQTTGPLSWVG